MTRLAISRMFVLISLVTVTGASVAQQDLIEGDWFQLQTPHFTVISDTSQRKARRFANKLESWRWAAAHVLGEATGLDAAQPFPVSPVPNLVYLFDSSQDYQSFVNFEDPGYFVNTPRANYMAVMEGDTDSFAIASHHYAHFLIKNFADLSLPRWYEEGMAAYMARLQIDGNDVEFDRFSRSDYETMAVLSESFAMDRLLYRDDALASPRVIQIANLKAESLLVFLLHAYVEENFTDRRAQLSQYLDLLRQGRNPRFAYDRAFDVTIAELEQEFHNYLLGRGGPVDSLSVEQLPDSADYQVVAVEPNELAILLAELALNLGEFNLAESYFRHAADNRSDSPRAQAGIGDALRMQEVQGMDQLIAQQFMEALTLGPNDINSLLDYGEYWEVELQDCEKTYPAPQVQLLMTEMEQRFRQALRLNPDNAEANLAMAQFYLMAGQQWQQGQDYQRKAFSLLPADTFVMEQAVKYAIADGSYEEAERLIAKLAAPIHFWGEPDWVQDLRVRLLRHQRNEVYDPCES